MSRVIKFRAWHEENKDFVYKRLRDFWSNGIDCVFASDLKPKRSDDGFLLSRTDEELDAEFPSSFSLNGEWEQFTGLHDKNTGEELYHNDIVTAPWGIDGPHVINWPDDLYIFREYAIEEELTKIGNVHENGDLLK